MDMSHDLFAEYTFGKIALQKIAPVEPNFRLYLAGWMGNANQRQVMKISGAVFREPTRGPNKGMLSIMVPKTVRTTYVTADEMKAFEKNTAASVQPDGPRIIQS